MENRDATFDRARRVDEQFQKKLLKQEFPISKSKTTPLEAGLSKEACLDLFDSQCVSRHLDFAARYLKETNQAFYTIGSSGHEGNAAIAKAFRLDDMAFLHYRSLAFMIQRAKQHPENRQTLIQEHLLALVAAKDEPISGGRHKIFGSLKLNVPPQTSTIASHLPKALGTAFSIQLAKELKIEAKLPFDGLILCSFGDASLNHSTAQGAINAAQWIVHHQLPLPIVWICEDNGLGISVKTPKEWVALNIRSRQGLEYIEADGLNFCDVYLKSKKAEHFARVFRKPVFLHFKTVRLLGHAGSDIEFHYHSLPEIEQAEANDPLLHSARILIENGFATWEALLAHYESVKTEIHEEALKIVERPKLNTSEEIMASIIPPKRSISLPPIPNITSESQFENQPRQMAQLLNRALTDILLQYPNVVVFGEDVGKKGGVYRITANLQKQFGQRRVFDTLLDEQTILGTAIGLAHNGFLPIPEIQFLAYTHNAEDQIRGEAATLSFFSKGQFTNPMVIRIPGLAYQKGFGGHFHNDNAIGFLREIPGLIILCPSNGVDAVKLLRKAVELAYQEQRVVVFLEPIALYMTKDLYEIHDGVWQGYYPELTESIHFGEMGIYGEGREIILISYGNGYYLCRQAEKILKEQHHIFSTIIDLRWLAPLNHTAILEKVKNFKNILIIDECRKTGSLSEEILSHLLENIKPLPTIERITGKDCFIPLGNAWQTLLPSVKDIVEMVLKMQRKH